MVEPVGPHRPGQKRLGQQGVDVGGGLGEVAVQLVGLQPVLAGAPFVLQPLAAHLKDGTGGDRHGLADAFAVQEGAIGGAQVHSPELLAAHAHPAVGARDLGVRKGDLGGRLAADGAAGRVDHEATARLQPLHNLQEMHTLVGSHPRLARRHHDPGRFFFHRVRLPRLAAGHSSLAASLHQSRKAQQPTICMTMVK